MDLKIKDNDLLLQGGDLVLLESLSELLGQRLYVRFNTFIRELSYSPDYGIDYLNLVFGRNRPKITVDTLFKNEILKEPMVDSLLSFKSKIVDYKYSFEFSVSLKEEKRVETFYILVNKEGVELVTNKEENLVVRI